MDQDIIQERPYAGTTATSSPMPPQSGVGNPVTLPPDTGTRNPAMPPDRDPYNS